MYTDALEHIGQKKPDDPEREGYRKNCLSTVAMKFNENGVDLERTMNVAVCFFQGEKYVEMFYIKRENGDNYAIFLDQKYFQV